MKKKLKNIIENKKIYLSPYNEEALKLQEKILSKVQNCNIIGFIDDNKIGDDIVTTDTMDTSVDMVLIVSHNYSYDIYQRIQKKEILHCKFLYIHKFSGKFSYNLFSDKPLKIVCFGNCQSNIIATMLKRYSNCSYNVKSFRNVEDNLLENGILEQIAKSDLIIYQPLDDKYGDLSQTKIEELAKENNTQAISFPYIYNDGIYSLEFDAGKKIIGEKIILDLYLNGQSKESIIEDYINNNINFKLKRRFKKSLAIMKNKEKKTDVKLTKFIQKNYQKKKLFYGHNHPTNIVIFELLRQIIQKANLKLTVDKSKKIQRLCTPVAPISPYDKEKQGFKFEHTYSFGWSYRGILIIEMIISNYIISNKNSATLKCR